MCTTCLSMVLTFALAQTSDPLLTQLDADFEELVKKERDPQPLRKAAAFFAQTNQSDRWTYYSDGIALLRQHRSPAGVPLLLKYMIDHTGYGSSHVILPAYVDTFAILTGKEMENPYRYVADRKTPVRNAVAELMRTWWTPNKDKITTDLGKMSREQHQVVLRHVLGNMNRSEETSPGGESSRTTPYAWAQILRSGLSGESRHSHRPTWWAQEFHPAMIPLLLEKLGFRDKPPETPERDLAEISWTFISVLAALHRNDEAAGLRAIAGDRRQNSAVRLTCLLALANAGEDLQTEEVLDILAREKKVDRKVVAILALEHAPRQHLVAPVLIKLLEDINRDVRSSAIHALRASRPRAALVPLGKLLQDESPGTPVREVLRLLGTYQTREGQQMLADYMRLALEDERKNDHVYEAVSAFQQSTGESWTQAGANPPSHYREAARKALAWWDAQPRTK